MSRYVWFPVVAVALLNAQTCTGSIRGRITDPSGLPVSGAAVTITETGSNTVRKTGARSIEPATRFFFQENGCASY